MAAYPLATYGTPEQRAKFLPEMLGGSQLGAYALSEAQAGSDISGDDHPGQAGGRGLRR